MSQHQSGNVRSITQICVHTVRTEESLNLITTLPICLVRTEHTTIIGRFTYQNLRIHIPVHKFPAQQTDSTGYFPVRCRTTFLFRSYPVPVSVRLVERTDVVELDAIVLLYSLHYIGQKTDVLFITVRFQICRTAATRVCSQAILRIIDGRRIEESQKFIDPTLLRQLQEVTLPLLLAPIVGPVRLQETFGTHPRRSNLTVVTLFRTACTDIKTPKRQTDTFGLSIRIILRTEQPVGYLILLFLRPKSDELHTPSVGSAEISHCLTRTVCFYLIANISGRLGTPACHTHVEEA